MPVTGDQKFLKSINRMALVRLIRGQPGLSRADLATVTGLTKSTVSLLAQELIDEGWLTEDDALVTGSIGRRPTPLRLDTERLALVGVDLNAGRLDAVATSITGEVIARSQRSFDVTDVPQVVAVVADAIMEIVKTVRAQGRTALGVGVAVPGPVHASSGILHSAPTMGWRDVPLRTELTGALALRGLLEFPVYVQRRAASAALGEVEFAFTPVEEPLLYIHLGLSIGAGVFVSDRLLSGHGGFAGDVGQQQLVEGGERKGSAESLISLRAMADELGIAPEAVQERLEAGDPVVREVVRRAGRHLGVLMHNLWSTFDPAQIVLGGVCCKLGSDYIDVARDTMAGMAKEAGYQVPVVSAARFGDLAVAIGATALVLHQLVRPV